MKIGFFILLALFTLLLIGCENVKSDTAETTYASETIADTETIDLAVLGKTDPEIAAQYEKFKFADANITTTVQKAPRMQYTEPITFRLNEKTVTVNLPVFTGIPSWTVSFRHARNYFRNGRVGVQVVLENNTFPYFLIDKTGKLLDEDYEYPTTNEIDRDIPITYTGDTLQHGSEDIYCKGLMTRDGEIITDDIFKNIGNFVEGHAGAILNGEERIDVIVDISGNIICTLPQEFENPTYHTGAVIGRGVVRKSCLDSNGSQICYLYSFKGERISDGYLYISGYTDGIAFIVTKDRKLGFIDELGNILLEPCIEYDDIVYPFDAEYYPDSFMEGTIILPISGEMAIIVVEQN
ncbi:MAG: hypothetical protein J6I45_00805 [Clostridia bacterium]|nr:hypothetical protein [Clostridia bacterium]